MLQVDIFKIHVKISIIFFHFCSFIVWITRMDFYHLTASHTYCTCTELLHGNRTYYTHHCVFLGSFFLVMTQVTYSSHVIKPYTSIISDSLEYIPLHHNLQGPRHYHQQQQKISSPRTKFDNMLFGHIFLDNELLMEGTTKEKKRNTLTSWNRVRRISNDGIPHGLLDLLRIAEERADASWNHYVSIHWTSHLPEIIPVFPQCR